MYLQFPTKSNDFKGTHTPNAVCHSRKLVAKSIYVSEDVSFVNEVYEGNCCSRSTADIFIPSSTEDEGCWSYVRVSPPRSCYLTASENWIWIAERLESARSVQKNATSQRFVLGPRISFSKCLFVCVRKAENVPHAEDILYHTDHEYSSASTTWRHGFPA